MPRPKKEKQATVRMTLEIPMLMRQAIRDRERMCKASGADVIRLILLTALRVEMEIIQRSGKPPTGLKAV